MQVILEHMLENFLLNTLYVQNLSRHDVLHFQRPWQFESCVTFLEHDDFLITDISQSRIAGL